VNARQVAQMVKKNGLVRSETQQAIRFSLRLAQALQNCGVPSHRLEETMNMLNQRLDLALQIFSSPSVIFASFGKDHQQRTFFLRCEPSDLHLERLARIDRLADNVVTGKVSLREGSNELDAIFREPERYGGAITIFFFMIASASCARLFNGGWREITAASFIGLFVGLLVVLVPRIRGLNKILMAVSAFGAILLAHLAVFCLGPSSIYIATVTGLIVLVPGLSLTVAMTELATGHPVSGTARLSNAMVTFLMLGFGLALGHRVAEFLPAIQYLAPPIPLPSWSLWIALALAPFSFAVLFRAKPSHFGWIWLASALSFFAARVGSYALGPQIGGFLAAFCLGIGSNLLARWLKRPASITIVPGLMLLVPGSVGFKSIDALLAQNTLAGLETAFTMILVAASLVTGLLFANFVLVAKRGT